MGHSGKGAVAKIWDASEEYGQSNTECNYRITAHTHTQTTAVKQRLIISRSWLAGMNTDGVLRISMSQYPHNNTTATHSYTSTTTETNKPTFV